MSRRGVFIHGTVIAFRKRPVSSSLSRDATDKFSAGRLTCPLEFLYRFTRPTIVCCLVGASVKGREVATTRFAESRFEITLVDDEEERVTNGLSGNVGPVNPSLNRSNRNVAPRMCRFCRVGCQDDATLYSESA